MKLFDLAAKFNPFSKVQTEIEALDVEPEHPTTNGKNIHVAGDFPNPYNPHEIRQDQIKDLVARWDQVSVHELVEVITLNPGLEDEVLNSPDLLKFDALQNEVPENYRGKVREAARDHSSSSLREYSEAYTTRSIEILAIDKAGNALLYTNTSWNYEDADGPSLDVMAKQEAFALIDNFRASHEIVKPYEAQGCHLPHDFDYAEGSTFHADHPEQYSDVALPGQTYYGPIEGIEDEHAIQRISDSSTIAHDLKRLVGVDLSQHVGAHVEIRYPHGQVGVVTSISKGNELLAVGMGEREHTQSMKRGAEFGG